MVQAYFGFKKEAIELTTSQPKPFHDHVTLCVHQEIHLEEGKYIKYKNKRKGNKEMSKDHTISSLPHLPLHLPLPPLPLLLQHLFLLQVKEQNKEIKKKSIGLPVVL